MDQISWSGSDDRVPTAAIADACYRLDVPFRMAPTSLQPIVSGMWCAGRALPVRHAGSVDVFLEALHEARPGDILVIDNGGRTDEGCIGDLVVLEAAAAGIGGVVVWGCHRDTAGLAAIALPLFSLGACAAGPRMATARVVPPRAASVGACAIASGDVVVADDDGILVLAAEQVDAVLADARDIQRTERAHADALAHGQTLRDQLRFDAYLTLRRRDPGYTFREHLRRMQSAVEA